jgi:hypothetical protein
VILRIERSLVISLFQIKEITGRGTMLDLLRPVTRKYSRRPHLTRRRIHQAKTVIKVAAALRIISMGNLSDKHLFTPYQKIKTELVVYHKKYFTELEKSYLKVKVHG